MTEFSESSAPESSPPSWHTRRTCTRAVCLSSGYRRDDGHPLASVCVKLKEHTHALHLSNNVVAAPHAVDYLRSQRGGGGGGGSGGCGGGRLGRGTILLMPSYGTTPASLKFTATPFQVFIDAGAWTGERALSRPQPPRRSGRGRGVYERVVVVVKGASASASTCARYTGRRGASMWR